MTALPKITYSHCGRCGSSYSPVTLHICTQPATPLQDRIASLETELADLWAKLEASQLALGQAITELERAQESARLHASVDRFTDVPRTRHTHDGVVLSKAVHPRGVTS